MTDQTRSPEEIEREIATERSELQRTIDDLQERLSFDGIMRSVTDSVSVNVTAAPVEALPGVLQAIARVIPLTRAFDATRIGIEGGEVAVADLVVAGAGSAVAVVLAFWFVLRQLRRFREQGWVTRFN